jgi:hypothetical protein
MNTSISEPILRLGSCFVTDVQKVGQVLVKIVAIYRLAMSTGSEESVLYRVERTDKKCHGPQLFRRAHQLRPA